MTERTDCKLLAATHESTTLLIAEERARIEEVIASACGRILEIRLVPADAKVPYKIPDRKPRHPYGPQKARKGKVRKW